MRRILLVGLLLLTGCAGLEGPRKRAQTPPPANLPYLPVREQEYWGRARLAYPEPSRDVGPRTYAEIPSEANHFSP